MSTNAEKLEAIEHSLMVARKRLLHLQTLKDMSPNNPLVFNKAQQYEMDQVINLIEKGERILKDSGR
jgi:hypothetical protein